jgi:tetratricopeptide (TPR) repeat protein
MSLNPESVGVRPDAAKIREELLSRLGLRASASDQDAEAAHNALVEFLELAPHDVKSWAAAQTVDVDKAFALLSGPERNLLAETQVASTTQVTLDETVPAPVVTPAAPIAPASPNPRRNQLVWAIVPLLIVGVVLGVFFMGKSDVPGIEGTPTNNATAAPAAPTAAPLDQAKVGALMKKVAANPKDIVSFQGLGDLYFASSDYKNASVWERKILGVDPKNEKALLSLGAAQFNLGNSAEAKKHWLVAAKLYPNSQEVHYDLGFLYMSQTPPDTAKMTAEWAKVVAIDPNSQLAKTVSSHTKVPTATPSAK